MAQGHTEELTAMNEVWDAGNALVFAAKRATAQFVITAATRSASAGPSDLASTKSRILQ